LAENGEILNNINQDMEDILNEINFNKFDNTQNSKIKEKLNLILQRKLKMDKLVEKNSRYEIDNQNENEYGYGNFYENNNNNNEYDYKDSNNILIENLNSCIKDHVSIFKKIKLDVETNSKYMKKIKNISEIFDKDKIYHENNLDENSKLYYFIFNYFMPK
jgi:hypothetical protein